MKIDLTESEKVTLKYALKARYSFAEDNLTRLKDDTGKCYSLGYILALEFYSDMKLNLESIYREIFNEDIRKEIKK